MPYHEAINNYPEQSLLCSGKFYLNTTIPNRPKAKIGIGSEFDESGLPWGI